MRVSNLTRVLQQSAHESSVGRRWAFFLVRGVQDVASCTCTIIDPGRLRGKRIGRWLLLAGKEVGGWRYLAAEVQASSRVRTVFFFSGVDLTGIEEVGAV